MYTFVVNAVPTDSLVLAAETFTGTMIIIYHYIDIIIGAMVSQITRVTIVYSTVDSGTDQRKRQSSAPLAFVRGIYQWPLNSLHKWPIMWEIFPFDNVIMIGAVNV